MYTRSMNELDLDPDKTTDGRHTPQMEWRDLAQGRAEQSFRGHVEHVWDGQIAASRILHGLENEQPLRVFSIHLCLRNTVQDFFLMHYPCDYQCFKPHHLHRNDHSQNTVFEPPTKTTRLKNPDTASQAWSLPTASTLLQQHLLHINYFSGQEC